MLFVFLDGVGLGSDDPAVNPLVAASMPYLRSLLGGPLTASLAPIRSEGLVFRQLDATLGVEGIPQSATGQSALLTGANAAAVMGRHYGPWPGPTLQRLLSEGTLFHQAVEVGGAVLANAYPPQYFASLGGRRHRPNAPVVAAMAAGVELRDLRAYRAGEAVAADVDGRRFAAIAPEVEAQGVVGAAAALSRLSGQASLVFYDVWPTDALGHARDFAGAVALLELLDDLLAHLSLGPATVVVTSDHGNLEDVTTKHHTLNPVPLVALGSGAGEFAGATALTDVAPAIRRLWRPP